MKAEKHAKQQFLESETRPLMWQEEFKMCYLAAVKELRPLFEKLASLRTAILLADDTDEELAYAIDKLEAEIEKILGEK